MLLRAREVDENEKMQLRKRNEELEEETMAQKHLLELEKIKTEKVLA